MALFLLERHEATCIPERRPWDFRRARTRAVGDWAVQSGISCIRSGPDRA